MIFALRDYLQFRKQAGPYGDEQSDAMAIAFKGYPPRVIVKQLLPGDLFVTQSFNHWFSWFMMYFSASSVDHCGIYVGDQRVIHQTFTTPAQDPLRYVAKGARILLIRLLDPARLNAVVGQPLGKHLGLIHRLSPKLQLTWVAVEISLGFYPERFRWRVMADLAISASLLDLCLHWVEPFPVVVALSLPLFGIALCNQARWFARRRRKLPLPHLPSHPDLVLKAFSQSGGMMFTSLGPLVCGPFGVLPLHVVRAIACGDAPEEESEAERQARTTLRGILEYLGAMEGTAPRDISP